MLLFITKIWAFYLFLAVYFALLIYAIYIVSKSKTASSLSKVIWVLLIIVIPFLLLYPILSKKSFQTNTLNV